MTNSSIQLPVMTNSSIQLPESSSLGIALTYGVVGGLGLGLLGYVAYKLYK
jgi:hypothetical protein